eukprot:COSAG05_NODE_1252_length_5378_cov_11.451411_1_plen_61_part_00
MIRVANRLSGAVPPDRQVVSVAGLWLAALPALGLGQGKIPGGDAATSAASTWLCVHQLAA